MKKTTVLLLTGDEHLEEATRRSANSLELDLVIGRGPGDAVRLFATNRDRIGAVLVDLDDCKNGRAWLSAMHSLSQKVPALAVSRLDPRFLKPLACRHGVEIWLEKPLDANGLTAAIQPLLPAARDPVAA